jgi:hypothetical protein
MGKTRKEVPFGLCLLQDRFLAFSHFPSSYTQRQFRRLGEKTRGLGKVYRRFHPI